MTLSGPVSLVARERIIEICTKIPGLGQRPFYRDDFLRLASKHNIEIITSKHVRIGAAYKDGSKNKVLINNKLHGHFRRLILAHEIAHFTLGHFSNPDSEEIEHESELVSAAAIFPFAELHRCISRHGVIRRQYIERYLKASRDHSDYEYIAAKVHIFYRNRIDHAKQTCLYSLDCSKNRICPFIKKLFFYPM